MATCSHTRYFPERRASLPRALIHEKMLTLTAKGLLSRPTWQIIYDASQRGTLRHHCRVRGVLASL